MLFFSVSAFASRDTIRSIDLGSPMFDPNELIVTSGDTVVFMLDNQYNALEVSFENWSDNNATGLSGGFSIPYGGGEFVPTPGVHYYICESETTMKGVIRVEATTSGVNSLTAFQTEIFPNPSSQTLFLKGTADGTVTSFTMTDLTGRVFLSDDLYLNELMVAIDVADLPRGIFIVTLSDGKTENRRKIILE